MTATAPARNAIVITSGRDASLDAAERRVAKPYNPTRRAPTVTTSRGSSRASWRYGWTVEAEAEGKAAKTRDLPAKR